MPKAPSERENHPLRPQAGETLSVTSRMTGNSSIVSMTTISGEHIVKVERSKFNQGHRFWFQLLRAPASLHLHPVQVLPLTRSHSRYVEILITFRIA